jgi:hypothetical protein
MFTLLAVAVEVVTPPLSPRWVLAVLGVVVTDLQIKVLLTTVWQTPEVEVEAV